METLAIQILNLLTTPPGNLVYHLVLAFAVITGLQFVLQNNSDADQNIPIRRMRLGFSILLLAQLLLFVSTALVWQGLISAHNLLPPLDRAVLVINLIWIFWLWAFPRPGKAADVLATLATAAAIIGFILTFAAWSLQSASLTFNATWLDWGWQIFSLVIVLAGMGVLLFKRSEGWGIGFAIALINLAGILLHMMLGPLDTNFAGFVRLAQLCSYPLLPSVVRRAFTQPENRAASAAAVPGSASFLITPAGEAPKRRTTTDARTVQAFLDLANEPTPDQLGPALARAIAHTMISDLCLIISAPDPFGQVVIQCGYDLIREEGINGAILDQKRLPNLASALARGKSIRLVPASGNAVPDLEVISNTLGLRDACPLMSIPLIFNNQPWGGIILLSPYTNRVWTTEDQNILTANGDAMSKVLKRAVAAPSENIGSLHRQLDDSRIIITQLQQENLTLRQTRGMPDLAEKASSGFKDDGHFQAAQEEAQNTIRQLESEKRQLLETISAMHDENQVPPEAQMEQELRLTLEQVAHLQNSLADANMKIMNLQHQVEASGQLNNEERDIITSIVQELRQPLSSIIGYTELLLGESVGILGALQRKFLERVKNSSERMRSLLDDLLLYTTMQSQRMEIIPQPVELSAIIDQAVSEASPKLREKNISLRIDMPEELPEMYADQDALQQIIIYLLQNAGTVTPMEGDVHFSVKVSENQGQPYLMLQVTDSGGGIDPEEITRVFSRRYRAENPTIQGVGDNGVGLAIAKTLVEAHSGRIWVESVPGQSSTFSVLLPIQPRK